MNNHPYLNPRQPRTAIDSEEILASLALELARVHACNQCRQAVPPLTGNLAQLTGEIARLHEVLISERLTSANLLAAIRAALGAAADGEADPLAYLRDELPADPGGAYGA